MKKLIVLGTVLIGLVGLSGCAPLLGAGAIIAADEAAEQEGGNLF